MLLARGGEITADTRASIDAHLAVCARCRSRHEALGNAAATLFDGLQDEDREHAAEAHIRRTHLATRLTKEARRDARPALRAWVNPRPLRFAAAAVAATITVVIGLTFREQPTHVGRPSHTEGEVGARPIASLTPGAVVDRAIHEVCRGTSSEPWAVPMSVRQEVLRNYGMEHVPEHEYELDYLVTPALGGTADPRNLWPERYASPLWNARVKDELEGLLPQLVCEGKVELATAQRDIARDWIAAYKKYFRTDRPIKAS